MERRTRKGTRTVFRDQEIPGCAQQASDVASLAFARSEPVEMVRWRGSAASARASMALRTYGLLAPSTPEKWALGFIEGRGHSGQP